MNQPDDAAFTPEFLDSIMKAYDVRGLVGDQLTEDFAFALGGAFAAFLEEEREPATVVIGEDMRPSSPTFAQAFADGVSAHGFDVIRIGLASTDMLYFASGKLGLPGVMFTASHNPASYNGVKMCRSYAKPIGQDSGLRRIRNLILEGIPMVMRNPGKISERPMLDEYVNFLLSLFGTELTGSNRRLKIAVDAGNGMAGYTAPAVLSALNVDVTPMYFDLDGTFPNHEANPIDAENMRDLQEKVKEVGADIGLAFDGDADRCFLVDERGEIVSPSALTSLIAVRELNRKPGASVIYNLISSAAVPEVIAEHGGKPVRSRVGHSFIKAQMAETGAIFGGEHSGHFYFSDFWKADSGMLAALYAIAELSGSDKSLSELLAPYNRYVSSGEINSKVSDAAASLALIKSTYSAQPEIGIDELDGLTVTGPSWWFNVRASNTEPLLRLNAEAGDQAGMEAIRDEVLELIRR